MSTQHHPPALRRALSAVASNDVDHGEWTAPNEGDREQADCIGKDKSYPIFKDGKLSAKGVSSALGYARTNDTDLVPHLEKIDDAIKKKEGKKIEASESEGEPAYALILALGDAEEMSFSEAKMPPKRNGIPCHYFYKESLLPGEFDDSKGNHWKITPKDIDDAISDTNRALLLGWEPPIQDDHNTPKKSFGFITGVRKNDRGGMELLHQFMGDDEAKEALRRKTSVMLRPEWTDTSTRQKYKWFCDHSAVCFRPQLKNLRDYVPALAASSGEPINAVYLTLSNESNTGPQAPNMKGDPDMDLSTISAPFRLALGDSAKNKSDADVLALAAVSLTAQPKLPDSLSISELRASLGDSANDATDAQIPMLALAAHYEGNQELAKKLNEAESERDTAKQQVLALSADDEEAMTPQVLALSQMAYEGRIDKAELERQAGKPGLNAEQAAWLRKAIKESGALMLSADPTTNVTEVDRMIAFAKLGHTSIDPNNPLRRGTPVKPMPTPPGTPLALEGKDDSPPAKMTDERRAELMALAEGH